MQAIRMDVDNGDESTITVPYPERSAKTIEEVFKGLSLAVALGTSALLSLRWGLTTHRLHNCFQKR